MLKYKNRIVFTGGSGRFAKAFKLIGGKTKFEFFFPKKSQLNILKLQSIKKYLLAKKPKFLIHLAGLSRPMKIHDKDICQSIDKNITEGFYPISNKFCSPAKISKNKGKYNPGSHSK